MAFKDQETFWSLIKLEDVAKGDIVVGKSSTGFTLQ